MTKEKQQIGSTQNPGFFSATKKDDHSLNNENSDQTISEKLMEGSVKFLAKEQNFAAIKTALDSGEIKIDDRYDEGYSLLDGAVTLENLDMVNELLSYSPNTINAGNPWGICPLARAVSNKNWDIAERLLLGGANVNACIIHENKHAGILESGRTPLHSVVMDPESSVESVKFLLDKGADVNALLTMKMLNTEEDMVKWFHEDYQECDEIENESNMVFVTPLNLIMDNESLKKHLTSDQQKTREEIIKLLQAKDAKTYQELCSTNEEALINCKM